jgi:hypothetical protein
MNMDNIQFWKLSWIQPDCYEYLLAESNKVIFSSVMRILNNCKLKTCVMITTRAELLIFRRLNCLSVSS